MNSSKFEISAAEIQDWNEKVSRIFPGQVLKLYLRICGSWI